MKAALFAVLAIFTATFALIWIVAIASAWRERRPPGSAPRRMPTLLDAAIGLVTNFFDTLGIGSFATTSSLFRFWGLVRDEQLPGTLNVGHAFPSILQAFIYIAVVQVDVVTLTLMIAAAVMGAWLGAGVVSRWPRRKVQIGMGIALLTAATVLLLTQLQLLPGGGDRLGLTGARLLAAVAANSVLGALMTMGIGLYAPCMMLIFLLGMTPRAAFPIMMGSCAFLMPVGSVQFIRRGSYNLKAALGLSLGGVPGVLLAAFLVKSLPLGAIRWLVMAAVVYTAVMMLRSAVLERQQAEVAAMPASSSAK